ETDATPTITYNQTSGNTIDSVGNEVENNQSTVATDSVSPTFVSAQTTIANRIDVTFSEAMTATGATPGDFVVGGTLSNTRTVISITVSGDDLQLELDGDLSESDSPTISFTNSGIRPTDTATSPNNLGDFGPFSFTIDLTTVPTPPQNLYATVVNYEKISISWDAPLDNGGDSISGYKIERESPIGGGWSVLVADTGNTDTDYTDSGLAENTEYNYRVSAINSKGASTPSDSAFAKTLLIFLGHSDDKSFPPEFLGIGFYKFNLISDGQIKSSQYENPTESFADYFPYSKYSDVLDKKKYENIGLYEKNGQYFLVDNYLKDIATFSADVDQPVQIQIRLLQERQTLEIHHLAIYLDTEGDSGKDALTYIIVDKDKPVKIVDPEGFFDDIVLNTSLEGTDFYYILDLTFKKPMNETDLFVEVWNENRDVSYLQMYDAFEIIDPSLVEEKIEELPTIVQVKLTHDASSPVCKSTNSCYTPKVANILEGGFVIWENQDSFLHTVTSGIPKTGADGKFNEIITPGNSFRYQFDTKGIYNYYCVIHPWATGMVKVYDNDGDLGTSPNTVEELSIKSQRHGSSVIIENQDVLIAERVLKFDVSGNLKDDLGRNPVSIQVTDPNGEKITIRGATNNDGYFTVPIIIYDWKPGSYSVSVNSKDTQIGSISFFAIQRYDY
ncbi:MAG: fibronectin type III domain-containing protein, partial [Nitrosopumilus sp.]